VIYDFPPAEDPIRQGDIFVGLPRADFSVKRIPILRDAGSEETTWEAIYDSGRQTEPVTAVVALRPVIAIVATQDCDTLRAPDLTLCEIRPFREVEKKSKDTKAPESWMRIIAQHARLNQKWFYLPPDPTIGFPDKMAVDFLATLRLLREDVESLRSLRKGRLNDVADEHFRERIAEFFRRYPYDEWYPLNLAELAKYREAYPDTRAYPWQR
jgi:hypothetical protein